MKGGYETAMGRTERDTEALFAKLSRLGINAEACAVDSAHMERVLWMCAMLIEQRTGRRLENADEVLSFVLKGE